MQHVVELAYAAFGAFVGFSGALWLQRRSDDKLRAAEEERNRQELASALDVVEQLIEVNGKALAGIALALEKFAAPLAPELDAASWDAVRSTVFRAVAEPGLRASFSSYFGQITRTERAVDMFLTHRISVESPFEKPMTHTEHMLLNVVLTRVQIAEVRATTLQEGIRRFRGVQNLPLFEARES